jgi:hypothetical protein
VIFGPVLRHVASDAWHLLSTRLRVDAVTSEPRDSRPPAGPVTAAPESTLRVVDSGAPILDCPHPDVLRTVGDDVPVTLHLACGCTLRWVLPAPPKIMCFDHGLYVRIVQVAP